MNEIDRLLMRVVAALLAFFVPFFVVFRMAHGELGVGAYVLSTIVGAMVLAAVFGRLTMIVKWIVGR